MQLVLREKYRNYEFPLGDGKAEVDIPPKHHCVIFKNMVERLDGFRHRKVRVKPN